MKCMLFINQVDHADSTDVKNHEVAVLTFMVCQMRVNNGVEVTFSFPRHFYS